ncbi:MAG: ABC transporter ATP-binding protein [Bacillota bacterium]|nr:ABC transporter ATP-binding protein [Bacillota bacterium]
MDDNPIIELVNITKSFDGEAVLENINLKIQNREFLTLLGPSGCGKTTMLRIIGGFVYPDAGDVFFNGQKITQLPPYKRNVNTVFQKYALFPFLNVYENIAFGLRIKKKPEQEIKEKVGRILSIVNLSGYEKRDVNSLSGGQQQRIAIARALVNEPNILLLDEPLGALDLKLRKGMQIELKNIQRQLGITFVYVTHDQEEALTMSDTIVVMNGGVIQQIGTPQDVYNEPVNPFVADFIGESNILHGVYGDTYSVSFAGNTFKCVDTDFKKNENVDVVIRPEDLKITTPDKGQISGSVESVIFKGVHYEIIVDQGGFKWMIHSTSAAEKGTKLGLFLNPDDIHIMKKGGLV